MNEFRHKKLLTRCFKLSFPKNKEVALSLVHPNDDAQYTATEASSIDSVP